MKRPTYREAINGIVSKDPKGRVIGLMTILEGLHWHFSRSKGVERRALTLKKKKLVKLISDFKAKNDINWVLDSFDDSDFVSQDYDFGRYMEQVNAWKMAAKSKKDAKNRLDYKLRKSGKNEEVKGVGALHRLMLESGISKRQPNGVTRLTKASFSVLMSPENYVGEVEKQLKDAKAEGKSRIGKNSRRSKRIEALKKRVSKHLFKKS